MPSTTKVLLAEDDPAARRLLAASLRSSGFEVFTAADGHEATKLLNETRPDVVVLDFEMPGLNGSQVCTHIRSLENDALRDIPVIMLTAHTGEREEISCLDAGANDFVTKPVSRAVLDARVRTQLRLRAMSLELKRQNEELARWRAGQEADLLAAKATQRTLIPESTPEPEGWEVHTLYQPVIQVGGDVFGWQRRPDGKWLLWIADAAGHGAAAALITSHVALLFNQACSGNKSPAEVLWSVNTQFHEAFHGRLFMTALCVLISDDGSLTASGAGHPPLLIRSNGKVRSVGPHGTMLGILSDLICEETTTTLGEGDVAFAYTDGMFSLRDKSGNHMLPAEMARAVEAADGCKIESVLSELERRSNGEPFEDDIAVIRLLRSKP